MTKAKQAYSSKLLDPRWQKKRLGIFQRDNFACTSCGDSENTLHVHHLKYAGNPWDALDNDLTTLCEHCHYLIESSKRVSKRIDINIIIYKIDKIKVSPLYYIFLLYTNNGIEITEWCDGKFNLQTILHESIAEKIAQSIQNYLSNKPPAKK